MLSSYRADYTLNASRLLNGDYYTLQFQRILRALLCNTTAYYISQPRLAGGGALFAPRRLQYFRVGINERP